MRACLTDSRDVDETNLSRAEGQYVKKKSKKVPRMAAARPTCGRTPGEVTKEAVKKHHMSVTSGTHDMSEYT